MKKGLVCAVVLATALPAAAGASRSRTSAAKSGEAVAPFQLEPRVVNTAVEAGASLRPGTSVHVGVGGAVALLDGADPETQALRPAGLTFAPADQPELTGSESTRTAPRGPAVLDDATGSTARRGGSSAQPQQGK